MGGRTPDAEPLSAAGEGGEERRYRISVDTGGTFSDFVLFDASSGAIAVLKIPSTPPNPAAAIESGLRRILGSGVAAEDVAMFAHGTTVATNALIERAGARLGLLVTAGMRGVYEVGEQTRPYGRDTYDPRVVRPAPLVAPRHTHEIGERVGADGTVVAELDEESVTAAARALADAAVEAVAICFLFSFLRSEHEQRARSLLERALPGCSVSISSEVLPQIREHARFSTTIVNAYCAPAMARYLGGMDAILDTLGLATRQRYVMQSNGALTTFAHAARRPVTTLLSGPAGGVTAAIALARRAGIENIVTFDMGGTSCDVALVSGGRATDTTRGSVGGCEVGVPMVEISAVGAGGGTLAGVESGGSLRVGPESAGADPGPAAYGRGGTRATVTDANVVLGYLGDRQRLGDDIELDAEAARAALAACVAVPLGLDLERAAAGVLEIVTERMADAIRAISTARGHDLREFTLVAYGGAGPLHAVSLAAGLGIRDVLVPPYPGVNSALGLLMTDVTRDHVRSELLALSDAGLARARELLDALAGQAVAELAGEGFAAASVTVERLLDMRYAGQGYEIPLALEDRLGASALRERFDARHAVLFGHAAPDRAVELVNHRVRVSAPVRRLAASEVAVPASARRRPHARSCHFAEAGGFVDCAVRARADLAGGERVGGPAIIEQADATIVIPPRREARVLEDGSLLIAIAGGSG